MMPSLESSVKSQFARIFRKSDWPFFKEMAEFSFSEAAFLKKDDFKKLPRNRRLLVRNSRKRLLIGIGTELLLKALYLKAGYSINQPKDGAKAKLTFPFRHAAAAGVTLDDANTYMLDILIKKIREIVKPSDPEVTDGLNIAKVFRNKEGHVVTPTHQFAPESFRAIERALVELYEIGFEERLRVRFSFAPNEKAAWKTCPIPHPGQLSPR